MILAIMDHEREFLVRTSHHLVLITSLPFVHTARRFNRLDDPANYMDTVVAGALHRSAEEVCEPYHLEDEEVVTTVSLGEPADGSFLKTTPTFESSVQTFTIFKITLETKNS